MNDALLGALLLISASPVYADEAFMGYGVGVFHDADDYTGQMKAANLGYRRFLFDGIYWQNKVGFWGEGSNDKTRSASAYGSTGLGMEIDLKPIEIRSGYGLAAISSPDSQLGSVFPQFNGEFYLGLRDNNGGGIGVQYEHISCAWLCSPNLGRDFVTVQLSQRW